MEEISLKQLYSKFKEYLRFFAQYWLILLIMVGLFTSYFVFKALRAPVKYSANQTFMMNEDNGGGNAGIGMLLGEFGFGGNSSGYNYNKIIQLSKSRLILNKLIRTKVDIQGKNDFLGNHIIELYELNDNWVDSDLENFKLTDSSQGELANLASFEIIQMLRGAPQKANGFMQVMYDEQTSIFDVGILTINEDLSIALCENLYLVLQNFYTLNSIGQHQSTFDQLKSKKDSIEKELSSVEYALADLKDRSHGIVLNKKTVAKDRMRYKVEMLYVMLGEATKNLETARFLLSSSSPFFQPIDNPMKPLVPIKPSLFSNLLKGIGIPLFLFILVFSLIKFFNVNLKS